MHDILACCGPQDSITVYQILTQIVGEDLYLSRYLPGSTVWKWVESDSRFHLAHSAHPSHTLLSVPLCSHSECKMERVHAQ